MVTEYITNDKYKASPSNNSLQKYKESEDMQYFAISTLQFYKKDVYLSPDKLNLTAWKHSTAHTPIC